ncbi:MAG: hypothetical protein R2706_03790 [Acidimicrobiales bacterium]
MCGKGISREASILDIAVDEEIVKKSGAWYTYEGDQLGQGREERQEVLAGESELVVEIQDRVLKAVGLIKTDEVEALLDIDEPISLD